MSRLVRDHAEDRGEKLIAAKLGIAQVKLAAMPGSASLKVKFATEVWETTTVSQTWIAWRLHVGSAGNVSLQLRRRKRRLES